jgi:hypothetical protein
VRYEDDCFVVKLKYARCPRCSRGGAVKIKLLMLSSAPEMLNLRLALDPG